MTDPNIYLWTQDPTAMRRTMLPVAAHLAEVRAKILADRSGDMTHVLYGWMLTVTAVTDGMRDEGASKADLEWFRNEARFYG